MADATQDPQPLFHRRRIHHTYKIQTHAERPCTRTHMRTPQRIKNMHTRPRRKSITQLPMRSRRRICSSTQCHPGHTSNRRIQHSRKTNAHRTEPNPRPRRQPQTGHGVRSPNRGDETLGRLHLSLTLRRTIFTNSRPPHHHK